jgi:sodium/proline symporter
MSTADSQLLASASAFASDVYRPVIRKKASDREMLWVGRIVVILISIAALIIAANPNSGSIMDLVGNAWGLFGAAFGPVIILSLFWRRLTFGGAVAGIVAGAVVDALWLIFLAGPTACTRSSPGFIVASSPLSSFRHRRRASKEVTELFDQAAAFKE